MKDENILAMSSNTERVGVPEVMREDVEQRVRSGVCGSACESLHKLIEEGLKSGPGRELTPERAAQLKTQALGEAS